MKNSTLPIVFPYDIVAAIAEQFWQDRTPLDVAATEPRWERAFACNGKDLRSMSLVHRSWTLPARNVLRRRAVVPFAHMTRFLRSSFCGPWVKEMILYWTINVRPRGVFEGDIETLGAILFRLPNLEILSLNTFLAHAHAPFRVDSCLRTITSRSNHLEELGIRHFERIGNGTRTHFRNSFEEVKNAFHSQLPSMHSIRLVALRRWSSPNEGPKELDLNPATALEILEMGYSIGIYHLVR